MGTNYYAEVDNCPTCGHAKDRYHIGKSSFGWTFSFRGYKTSWDDIQITSWKDWREFLNRENVKIKDEYGKEIYLNEFEHIVLDRGPNPNNHAREAISGKWGNQYAGDHWIDPEGHGFSGTEFS